MYPRQPAVNAQMASKAKNRGMSAKSVGESFSAWRRLLFARETDAAAMYSFFRPNGVHLAADGAPLLNMGYWRGISSTDRDGVERANYALFDLVIDTAEIHEGETVVDAGAGALSSTLRCATRTGAARIVTLNTCAPQNRQGLKRLRAAKLLSRVDVLDASATRMPLAKSSVDRVLAVESALHFEPREDFFAEAARVLKPGGTLTLVDLIAAPPATAAQRFFLATSLRGIQMPRVNLYDREEYARRVEDAGFRIRGMRSIRTDVVLSFRNWLIRHPAITLSHNIFFEVATFGFFFYPWDYLLLHAERE